MKALRGDARFGRGDPGGAHKGSHEGSKIAGAVTAQCIEVVLTACDQCRGQGHHDASGRAPAPQDRVDEGAADAAVAVCEGVDRLELRMRDRGLQQCRHAAAIGEGDEVIHVARHRFRRRRDTERASRGEIAATDPVLHGTELTCGCRLQWVVVDECGVRRRGHGDGSGVRADAVQRAGVVVDVRLDLLDLR